MSLDQLLDTVEARLEESTDRRAGRNGCWPCSRRQISVLINGVQIRRTPAIWSYMLNVGVVPDKAQLNRYGQCRRLNCVNPRHLQLQPGMEPIAPPLRKQSSLR